MKNKLHSLILHTINIENKITAWNQRKTVKTLNFIAVISVSFIGVLLLNLAHPIFGDDWGYSLVGGDTNQRITNLSEIFIAQYHHYFDWGGRSIVHIIAQFLLMIDEKWADLINSCAYVLLTLVIYKIAVPSKQLYPSVLILINLLICFFQVQFGSTILWTTGSANYLWGTLIILAFLLPFVSQYRKDLNETKNDSLTKIVLLFLCGIIAGWTNENMAIGLIFILLLFILAYKWQGKEVAKWTYSGLIGASIGAIIMLVAPGNFARYKTSLSQTSETSSTITTFLHQVFSTFTSFYIYALGLTFIFALAMIISSVLRDETKQKEGQQLGVIFFLGALVATLAMSASPIFPGRASFGINTLIIVSIAVVIGAFDFKKQVVRRLISCLVIFGLLFYAVDYYRGYKDLKTARILLDKRLEVISEEKQKGNFNITLHDTEIIPQTRYLHYYELRSNTDDWHNRMFSLYHQLDSVRFENP